MYQRPLLWLNASRIAILSISSLAPAYNCRVLCISSASSIISSYISHLQDKQVTWLSTDPVPGDYQGLYEEEKTEFLQDRGVCYSQILLDSELLLEHQVAAVSRRAFVQLHLVHQLWPFLDHGHSHSCRFFLRLLGLPLESIQKIKQIYNAEAWTVMVHSDIPC